MNHPRALAWQLSGGLDKPESAAFDENRSAIYVSNMAGAGWPPDTHEKGFISLATADGTMQEPQWVTGLHEVKNLAVRDNRLYAADVGRLVVVDVESANIVAEHPAPGSEYLDGIAIRPDGTVFVGDLAANTIWRLDAATNTFEQWLTTDQLDQPDGLIAEDNRLIVGGFGKFGPMGSASIGPQHGHLKSVDYQSKTVTSVGPGTPIGNIDGIAPNGADGWFVADHVAGKVYSVDSCGASTVLLTSTFGVSDIEYIPTIDVLLVAHMYEDTVAAYRCIRHE
jgi:DNA-binding beta-propeller fold protein YncE